MSAPSLREQNEQERRREYAALVKVREFLIDRGAGGRRSGPLALQGDHEATDLLIVVERAMGIP